MNENERKWSPPIRYMGVVAIIGLFALLLNFARSSITLILLALLIAYLLSPIVKFLNKTLRIKRKYAVLLAYLFLAAFIVLIFSFVMPVLAGKVQEFIAIDWPATLETVDNWMSDVIQEMEFQSYKIGSFEFDLVTPMIELRKTVNSLDLSKINITSIFPDMNNMVQSVLSVSANVIGSVVSVVIALLTTIMASVHFCNDGYKLQSFLVKQFRKPYRPEVNELMNRLLHVWHNYFAGEIKLMTIIGVTTFFVTSGLGIRWSLALGVIAGFCEVVPNIGPIISCIPAMISALVFGSTWIPLNNFWVAIIVGASYVVIQQLENIVIVPRVMSNALDLHPVVIILGIMILSSKLGVFGALLAAPLIGLGREILSFFMYKIRGEDPYPLIYEIKTEPPQPSVVTTEESTAPAEAPAK